MQFFKQQKHTIIILILFSAFLFFVGLGAMPLTDPDETFYAETAKEMLTRGEIITPYIFGKPQFEKPPLYYWLVISSFKAFGVNEFAARFPSAIIGILGVIGIYLLGSALVSRKTGFLAGVVLATSIQYLVLSRGCVTDILLGVTILYAFLFFFYAYLAGSGKTKWYLLSAACLGLAVLTKGPIGLLLPAAIIALYMLFTGEIKRLKEIPIFRGAVVFLIVALPWYLLAYKAHGSEFIDAFFGFHNVVRFLHPEHASGDIFYYYAPIIAVGFLPWTIFLPMGIWQSLREKSKAIKKADLFLLLWFLVIVIFFSISRTKLPTYVFPVYPALALLLGRMWDAFSNGEFTRKMEKGMNVSAILLLAAIVGGSIAAYLAANYVAVVDGVTKVRYPSVAIPALIVGLAFSIAILFFVRAILRRKYTRALATFMISFAIFTVPLAYIVLPEIGKYESSKAEAEELLELVKPGEKFGAETKYVRGIAFYMDTEDVLDIHPHHVMTDFLDKKERVWCLMKEKNHRQLYEARERPYLKPTYIVYQFGKKVIVTNKIPDDGVFLKMRSKDEY